MSWLFCLIAVVSVGQLVTADNMCSMQVCSWTLYPNTNIPGGISEPATTLTACQSACLAINGCVSVDWKADAQACWIQYTQDGKQTYTNIDHYDYVCAGYCPDGFTYLPLARSCYRVVYEGLTWAAADAKCRQLHSGAHLAAITSQEENNALKSFVRLQFDTNPASAICEQPSSYGGKKVWTSGQRLDETSCIDPIVWKLSECEHQPLTFTDWNTDTGEPNCSSNNEQCMVLASSWNYRWNDVSCSSTSCALCEYLPA